VVRHDTERIDVNGPTLTANVSNTTFESLDVKSVFLVCGKGIRVKLIYTVFQKK